MLQTGSDWPEVYIRFVMVLRDVLTVFASLLDLILSRTLLF